MIALAIIASGILYRIPRGGPGREWWADRGLILVSRLNEEIWAVFTGIALALAFHDPWPLITAPLLWLGEKPGYMHMVSDEGNDVWGLNGRGMLLANPIMGFIYEGCRRIRSGKPSTSALPVWQPYLDGWTAYAELLCGLTTAAVYALIWSLVL